jgi:hypothetical protein
LGESARLGGENRQPGVVSHRAQRIVAPGHVGDDQPPLLGGVAEHPAQGGGVEAVVGQGVERSLDVKGLGADPVAIGPCRGQRRLDLIGVLHLAGLTVEDDELARAELAVCGGLLLLSGADPGLGGNEEHFGRDRPAGGAKPVAIHAHQQR